MIVKLTAIILIRNISRCCSTAHYYVIEYHVGSTTQHKFKELSTITIAIRAKHFLLICSHHYLVHPREQGFSFIYCSQIPEIAALL